MANRVAKTLAKFRGTLVLVGAGKMGSAMLDGWLARGLKPRQVVVIEPEPGKMLRSLARRGLRVNPKVKSTVAAAVVIAVKPQNAAEALQSLSGYIDKSTFVLSIMAGRTIGFLQNSLPPRTAIVRGMPNTPAAIGRGISVAVPNANVSAQHRNQASSLLAAIGEVEWVRDERLMDAVTALSGSGPAYVFLLAEAMASAGIASGLPPALATRLARETVAGAGELMHRSDVDATTLRQNVTSPGGTTAAALEVLMGSEGLERLLTRAIEAATRRSRDLAG
jgi:pyrroline-5-carboxylate reductase